MTLEFNQIANFDPRFKIFHELMSKKIREVLLISSPYDAWIMEEDCRLSERIINEYRGLNLSHPPRLAWVSTTDEALVAMNNKDFDMVIIVHSLSDVDASFMGKDIKKKAPDLPVVILTHGIIPSAERYKEEKKASDIDRSFVWRGNTELLLALIKSSEDRMSAAHDSESAGIRVIIYVEDSPEYTSSILPILYKELVSQTQAVMEEGLNQEHRLLSMRARPKILIAETYEEALSLYHKFEPYVLGVISDTRFPRNGSLDNDAGIRLLNKIRNEHFDIPLLLMSSEPKNASKAKKLPAVFVDKNSSSLLSEVRSFFLDYLGFGDFIFRMPDGNEIARAANLRQLEKNIIAIPEESFIFHCNRNDFSRWLFARTEIELASRIRPIRDEDFQNVQSHREYLVSITHSRRMGRQKGIVVNFDPKAFDKDTEFLKIGNGSLGGKARGLAFMSSLLHRTPSLQNMFEKVDIYIPQTLVITTDGFEEFINENKLILLANEDISDEEIAQRFENAKFPEKIEEQLNAYLTNIKYPLAVRSSSLLEDAQFRAYAGLYKTYMLSNDNPDIECRIEQLINAVKMVYASTYFKGPKSFSKRVGNRTEDEKMAVIIQEIVGKDFGNYLYPAISGVAQSYNYYPFSKMKPEEGIATIALGLGKHVMEGGKSLRFSPRYPELLPQNSTIDDILKNSQQYFYALKLNEPVCQLGVSESATLEKRDIFDAQNETYIKALTSTYIPEEQRIRDSFSNKGYPVLTFAQILKYKTFPLPDILNEMLAIAQDGMGCPVEIEFSVNLKDEKPQFAILQTKPMSAHQEMMSVHIDEEEIKKAFCVSTQALGNAIEADIADIVYVKPDIFDPVHTPEIADEISRINSTLLQDNKKYLLIGPGRWGSSDRWLGIPVHWSDICGVGAMLEIAHPRLKPEPSQGSHFFHNIISLGINYLTVHDNHINYFNWDWITSLPIVSDKKFIAHIRLEKPVIMKVDGRESFGVIIYE